VVRYRDGLSGQPWRRTKTNTVEAKTAGRGYRGGRRPYREPTIASAHAARPCRGGRGPTAPESASACGQWPCRGAAVGSPTHPNFPLAACRCPNAAAPTDWSPPNWNRPGLGANASNAHRARIMVTAPPMRRNLPVAVGSPPSAGLGNLFENANACNHLRPTRRWDRMARSSEKAMRLTKRDGARNPVAIHRP